MGQFSGQCPSCASIKDRITITRTHIKSQGHTCKPSEKMEMQDPWSSVASQCGCMDVLQVQSHTWECMCMHLHHRRTCLFSFLHAPTHARTHTHRHMHAHKTHVCTHRCMHTDTDICMNTDSDTCMHTHIGTCMHTCT